MKKIILLLICIIELSEYSLGQTITSINPSNGDIGESIQITGTGFDTNTQNNIVTFYNGVTATTVASSTSTLIVVRVPSGAISGPIYVTVNNARSSTPDPFFIVNNQQFSLAASFVSSIGSSDNQFYAQPNIVASSSWTINNSAISFRVTGLFSNKDTSRFINATNLFKPELSNLSIKLALLQRLKPNGGLSKLGIGIETNIYSQTLQSLKNNEAIIGSITSFLGKIGIQWAPVDGIIFFLNYQTVTNLSGLANYKVKFGDISTSFSNLEFSGMYRVQDGPLKNLYFQPSVMFADNSIHDLTGNKDATIVLIRIGYTAGF